MRPVLDFFKRCPIMKKIIVAILIMVSVLGCTGVGEDVGIDCGSDIECFKTNAETCTPAYVEYTLDAALLKMNILEGTPAECQVNIKIKDVTLPEDAAQSVKAAVPLAKRTSMLCTLTSDEIIALQFSQEILDKCEGTLSEILGSFVNVEGAAPSLEEEDEIEIPPEAYNEDGSIDWQIACDYNEMIWDEAAGVCLEEGAEPGGEAEPEIVIQDQNVEAAPAPEAGDSGSTNPGELEFRAVRANIDLDSVNYDIFSSLPRTRYNFDVYDTQGNQVAFRENTHGDIARIGITRSGSVPVFEDLQPGGLYKLTLSDPSDESIDAYYWFTVPADQWGAPSGSSESDELRVVVNSVYMPEEGRQLVEKRLSVKRMDTSYATYIFDEDGNDVSPNTMTGQRLGGSWNGEEYEWNRHTSLITYSENSDPRSLSPGEYRLLVVGDNDDSLYAHDWFTVGEREAGAEGYGDATDISSTHRENLRIEEVYVYRVGAGGEYGAGYHYDIVYSLTVKGLPTPDLHVELEDMDGDRVTTSDHECFSLEDRASRCSGTLRMAIDVAGTYEYRITITSEEGGISYQTSARVGMSASPA